MNGGSDGGGTAENDEVDRERREGEKSLDLLKVFLIYCLCLFLPSHFTSSHIPLCFSFSSSIRGPVQFVSVIVSRSLRFFLWKIERCVCVGEGDEESERNRENAPTTRQHSAVSNYLGFCLQCGVSQKIPAQSYMVESMSVCGCVCGCTLPSTLWCNAPIRTAAFDRHIKQLFSNNCLEIWGCYLVLLLADTIRTNTPKQSKNCINWCHGKLCSQHDLI